MGEDHSHINLSYLKYWDASLEGHGRTEQNTVLNPQWTRSKCNLRAEPDLSTLPIIRALPRVCYLAEPRLVPPLANNLHAHGQLQIRIFWRDPVSLYGWKRTDGERQRRVAGSVKRATV